MIYCWCVYSVVVAVCCGGVMVVLFHFGLTGVVVGVVFGCCVVRLVVVFVVWTLLVFGMNLC